VRNFREFEKSSSLSGLTFYLISNHILVDELPSYGDDVVAVIRSDEECWIPPYLNKEPVSFFQLKEAAELEAKK
jgi:hypothetical protein